MSDTDVRNSKTDEMLDAVEKETKKPRLKLAGRDGNAFAILGAASSVARKNNMDWNKIRADAMSGDYHHLLAVMMDHFDVE